MRIHLGGDHAAFDLQRDLVAWLTDRGHEVSDHGPAEFHAEDDYPVFVLAAARAVADDPGSLGIVLGGSGNGEQIAANKVSGIRAALAWQPELATLARQHNNAQVVSIGARFTDIPTARGIVAAFLDAEYTGEERHARRIDLVSRFEETGDLPVQ